MRIGVMAPLTPEMFASSGVDKLILEEITNNRLVLYPHSNVTGYYTNDQGFLTAVLAVQGTRSVRWSPRCDNEQAMQLFTALYMENTIVEQDDAMDLWTVSISVPALDKPLTSGEYWSMASVTYGKDKLSYAQALRQAISETAALSLHRTWPNAH